MADAKYFGRKCRLLAGSFTDGETEATAWDLSDLDYDFEVSRSIVWYENSAKFSIYNPSTESINRVLYSASAFKLEAGYDQATAGTSRTYGTIFIGNVYKAWPEFDGDDLVLQVICKSARGPNYQLTLVPITLSFRKGTSLFDVVKTVADYAAIPLIGAESLKDKRIGSDFNYSGSVAGALLYINTELIWTHSSHFTRIHIDNSQLVFVREDGEQAISYVSLGYDSGLISCIPYRDESENELAEAVQDNIAYYYTGDPKYWQARHEKVKEERKRVKFTALINAGIMPGTKVHLNTAGGRAGLEVLDNDFYVRTAKFAGNNYGGKFQVDCEAVLSPSIKEKE